MEAGSKAIENGVLKRLLSVEITREKSEVAERRSGLGIAGWSTRSYWACLGWMKWAENGSLWSEDLDGEGGWATSTETGRGRCVDSVITVYNCT